MAAQQQQHYYPELFGYMPTTQEQIYALQAQLHAQAQAQAQMMQGLSQAQAQYQNQQSQQNQHHNSPPSGNQASQEALHHFQQQNMTSWRYLASLYGFNMIYPGLHLNATETATAPTSPPRTPASTDTRSERQDQNRVGLGRGGRRGGNFSGGLRSQSQPPSFYPMNGYSHGMPVGLAGSEDDDYADNSSNGKTPETPPAEESLDEYVGYYTIGGSLHTDVAVVDSQAGDVEEPFIEQKTMVDRTKRYSQEKLPTPMISRDPSPKPLNRQSNRNYDTPASRPKDEDRKPSTSNANGTNGGLHNVTSSGGRPLPFNGFDGASDNRGSTRESRESAEHHAQRLDEKNLQVHGQESLRKRTSQTFPQNGYPVPTLVGGVMAVYPEGQLSDDQNQSLDRQVVGQPLSWPGSRASGASPPKAHGLVKPKSVTSSNEDLAVLTPVPEARTPSPSTRKSNEPKPIQKQMTNGTKTAVKPDPVPPTPADKTASKNGNGRSKNSSNKSGNGGRNSEAKGEAKSGEKPVNTGGKRWSKNKQPKKRNASNATTTANAAAAPQAHNSKDGDARKGG
jgi:hypothetical protein